MTRNGKADDLFWRKGVAPGGQVVVSYADRMGVVWRAYELTRPGLGPALVFESTNAIRVVRDYPADWHTLPRAALEALSWCV